MIFQHPDGRYMVRTPAGGTGGGVTHHFDRLATEEEIAEFVGGEKLPELRADDPAPPPEPSSDQ